MAVSKALLGVLAVLACIQVSVAVGNDGPEGNHGGFSLDQLIQQLDLTTNVPVESSSASEENQITKVPERQPLDPNFDESNSINIAKNVLDLSQKLVRNVLASSKKNYEILSPISIASALQLALLGSYGSTFNELMSVLGYNKNAMSGLSASTVHQQFGFLLEDLVSNDLNYTRARSQVPWRARASNSYINRANKAPKNNAIPNHTITVANGIFVQKGFSIRPEYNDAVKSVYNSEFRAMDFRSQPLESAKELNKWVNDKTNGRIKELIPGAVDSETLVILANALYFKADWQQTFIEGATSQKKFYPNGKDDAENFVMVDMMANGGDFAHYYDKESDCEILGLPYKKNASTMYVIMPKNSSSIVLKQKQELLTAEKIEFMISQMTIKTAVILFPKMHLSGGYHLKGSLLDLGLKALFKQGKSDLSLLADGSVQAAIPSRHNSEMASAIHFPNVDDEPMRKFKRDVTYKVPSETKEHSEQLTLKDLILKKRIVKESPGKKAHRIKRDLSALQKLDSIRRNGNLKNPFLFADEVIHKVDLEINEQGTEGGAATAITLNRSGTNVVFRTEVPFMILIRHDPTRLPLFYGTVFNPLS